MAPNTHVRLVSQEGAPGHNKFDFGYSLGELRPEYLVAMRTPIDEDRARKGMEDRRFGGSLYFDPYFQEKFFPNPLWTGVMTIFAGNGEEEPRKYRSPFYP